MKKIVVWGIAGTLLFSIGLYWKEKYHYRDTGWFLIGLSFIIIGTLIIVNIIKKESNGNK